ncbi:MAG: hypothetical protein KGS61_15860, partial [Verrucomicrobia bacterium]|nr:hypothetical protein [Verrucomicrobiota bacterium]
MRPPCEPLALLAVLATATAGSLPAQEWLDQASRSLTYQSSNGRFHSSLSGLLDLEGYYIDQRPPGMIFGDNQDFFNPRLTLFLDTWYGTHFYSLVQVGVDRGVDPREQVHAARFDQYLLRYIPFEDSRLNLQFGKFATVFGNWVSRHYSWDNPFLNAPLPYENFTILTDQTVPGSPAALVARLNKPDLKSTWIPLLWGPVYAAGGAVLGQLGKADYAVEVKNTPLSARPDYWSPLETGWDSPTVSGRIGLRPSTPWALGASFSYGSYLQPDASGPMPAGLAATDFHQLTAGQD